MTVVTAELQLITPALRRKLTFEKISQEEINFWRKLTFGISKSQEEINFFDKKYCKKLISSNPYFKKF